MAAYALRIINPFAARGARARMSAIICAPYSDKYQANLAKSAISFKPVQLFVRAQSSRIIRVINI